MLTRLLRSFTSRTPKLTRTFTTTQPLLKPPEMEKINTSAHLSHLRQLMKDRKIDIYIVPSEDAHSSEYIAPTDARRQFISGFSGSAGTAVITHEKAALATDGRYFNQAGHQLDGNWTLLKQGLQDVLTWQEWVVEQAEEGGSISEGKGKRVGVDPTTITASEGKKLGEKIKKKSGGELVPVAENLVDIVWGDKKPARTSEPVMVLGLEYAGKSYEEKVEELRKELAKKKAVGFVVSMLDEVAWLFNLRGNDIPFNPVFFSYAVVTATDVTLYVDESKLEDGAKKYLEKVNIKPYNAIFSDLTALAAASEEQPITNGTSNSNSKTSHTPPTPNKRKYLISTKASWALSTVLGGEENVDEIRSLIGDAKAIKNENELKGMRECHIRDGAALSEYFAWLEEQLGNGEELDEVQAADKLEEKRKKHGGKMFMGLSFPTISSSGANAATIHYKPERGNCSTIDPGKIYLCDSGAQYLDGTTDTTRTLHFGEPTQMEKEAYTLVLKGHIALEKAVFPKGTSGFALDSFARQFLWSQGLEYRHGTGHGIGSFLNVHEGPIGIGTRVQYSEVPLSAGNVISNEPGYYEDDSFGIRIENVIMVKEVQTKFKFGDKPYFGFEHVTLVPMCRRLVEVGMLTEGEREWLNAYHREVLEKTRGFFEGDKRTLEWLERECKEY